MKSSPLSQNKIRISYEWSHRAGNLLSLRHLILSDVLTKWTKTKCCANIWKNICTYAGRVKRDKTNVFTNVVFAPSCRHRGNMMTKNAVLRIGHTCSLYVYLLTNTFGFVDAGIKKTYFPFDGRTHAGLKGSRSVKERIKNEIKKRKEKNELYTQMEEDTLLKKETAMGVEFIVIYIYFFNKWPRPFATRNKLTTRLKRLIMKTIVKFVQDRIFFVLKFEIYSLWDREQIIINLRVIYSSSFKVIDIIGHIKRIYLVSLIYGILLIKTIPTTMNIKFIDRNILL